VSIRFPKRTSAERLRIAELSGMVENLVVGADKWVYAEPAVAQLHAITTDRVLLGDVLGVYLARLEESAYYDGAVELLRAAGADEQVAAEMLEWQHERRRREQQTPTAFDVPGEQG
jgi:hypothetical protein